MPRITVVGNSASGKTTAARSLARELSLAHIELDAMFHGPGWIPTPTDEFRARLIERLRGAEAGGGWVVDGNYLSHAGDLTVDASDTVVWFDLPRRTVMRQVVQRTLIRVVCRQELWNGNRELWRNLYRWDPEESIIRWAWTQHDRYRRTFAERAEAAGDTWNRVARPRDGDAVVRHIVLASRQPPGDSAS